MTADSQDERNEAAWALVESLECSIDELKEIIWCRDEKILALAAKLNYIAACIRDETRLPSDAWIRGGTTPNEETL